VHSSPLLQDLSQPKSKVSTPILNHKPSASGTAGTEVEDSGCGIPIVGVKGTTLESQQIYATSLGFNDGGLNNITKIDEMDEED